MKSETISTTSLFRRLSDVTFYIQVNVYWRCIHGAPADARAWRLMEGVREDLAVVPLWAMALVCGLGVVLEALRFLLYFLFLLY